MDRPGYPVTGDIDLGFQLDPAFPPATATLAATAHADGRLLTVFEFATSPELLALNGDGSLDPSFSAGGILTKGVVRLAVDAFSRTVASPYASSGGESAEDVVVRLRLDGEPDPDLMVNVGRTFFHGSGTALLVQNNSQIVVAGDRWQPEGLLRSTVIRLSGSDERRVKPFRLADGRPVLRINSRTGRNYRVERSPRLNPAEWTEVKRLPGTGGVVDWTGAEAEADRFYRVLSEWRFLCDG